MDGGVDDGVLLVGVECGDGGDDGIDACQDGPEGCGAVVGLADGDAWWEGGAIWLGAGEGSDGEVRRGECVGDEAAGAAGGLG